MAQFSVNTHRLDPYKNFKFKVVWDGSVAVSEIDFIETAGPGDAGDVDGPDFVTWQAGVSSPPPAASSTESIEYELVARDGTSTTCVAELDAEELSLGFTPIVEPNTGRIEVDIADECVALRLRDGDLGPGRRTRRAGAGTGRARLGARRGALEPAHRPGQRLPHRRLDRDRRCRRGPAADREVDPGLARRRQEGLDPERLPAGGAPPGDPGRPARAGGRGAAGPARDADRRARDAGTDQRRALGKRRRAAPAA